MFSKILVANRGEIAVRVIRSCRDMGIATVALYDDSDVGSLHVRLADACVRLASTELYHDPAAIVQIARDAGADAIHPGYGFLAESPELAQACEQAGVAFIGPSSATLAAVRDKLAMIERVAAAGFDVPRHSGRPFAQAEAPALQRAAVELGYPLAIKSYSGGRSHGTRVAHEPQQLEALAAQAHAAAHAAFGDDRLFLQETLPHARYIEVQLLGDGQGNVVHLGERDGSLQHNHRKILEESPAPGLHDGQRAELWRRAVAIGRLLKLQGAATVEFLLGADGSLRFTEIKARIQVEHPISELITGVDLVREQIRLAAGEPLSLRQEDIQLRGVAMQVRINAEDPWNNYLPSPGRLLRFRFPGGPHVRVDTYAYGGCNIPVRYDPLLAKVVAWDETREGCLRRLRRAVGDFAISGVQTNLPLVLRVLDDPEVREARYDVEFARRSLVNPVAPSSDEQDAAELRDLAVAAALAYARRSLLADGALPERAASGWHRDSRKLPS